MLRASGFGNPIAAPWTRLRAIRRKTGFGTGGFGLAAKIVVAGLLSLNVALLYQLAATDPPEVAPMSMEAAPDAAGGSAVDQLREALRAVEASIARDIETAVRTDNSSDGRERRRRETPVGGSQTETSFVSSSTSDDLTDGSARSDSGAPASSSSTTSDTGGSTGGSTGGGETTDETDGVGAGGGGGGGGGDEGGTADGGSGGGGAGGAGGG